MSDPSFFDEPSDQSKVKAEIVARYFRAWAKVICSKAWPKPDRIAYIDLFAGKGKYDDGTYSTPLMVLERIITDPALCSKVVTIFNDADLSFIENLQKDVSDLPGISELKFYPEFHCEKVGERVAETLANVDLVPTLMFVDPWGYKGLSLDLINSVLRNKASEVIFFFNYNRINAAISNDVLVDNVFSLLEEKRARDLRDRVYGKPSHVREKLVINAVKDALKSTYARHVLPFRFYTDGGKRISHHLIFATKHELGLHIMKEIMAAQSTANIEGVPTYEFNPKRLHCWQHGLFQSNPIAKLGDDLAKTFAGDTITMEHIYFAHHVDKLYVKQNYKRALLHLEAEHRIKVHPSSRKRPGTMPDKSIISFREA